MSETGRVITRRKQLFKSFDNMKAVSNDLTPDNQEYHRPSQFRDQLETNHYISAARLVIPVGNSISLGIGRMDIIDCVADCPFTFLGKNTLLILGMLDHEYLESLLIRPLALACCSVVPIRVANASPSDHLLSEEEIAYNKGDFSAVVIYGEKLLAMAPHSATARYDLAGALVKLNRRKDAEKEYALCQQQCTDLKMKEVRGACA